MISGNAKGEGLVAALVIMIVECIGAVLAGIVFRKINKPQYLEWRKKMMQ